MAKGVSRDRRREAYWRGIIREHRRSGLSIRRFCRKSKLHESAFYFWRGELQRRGAEHVSGVALAKPEEQRRPVAPLAAPAFVPVRVEEHSTPAGGSPNGTEYRLVIELPGGRRVHVTTPVDRAALADVIAVLEGLPSEALAKEGQPC